ncbi:MAG: hypothetical protein ACJ8CR_16480, partial [Roseiflexaceae bacterium]
MDTSYSWRPNDDRGEPGIWGSINRRPTTDDRRPTTDDVRYSEKVDEERATFRRKLAIIHPGGAGDRPEGL